MRASLTRNGKFGAGLWLDGRLVARVVATVEDSRITPEESEPRWLRDAMVFVHAVNATTPDTAVPLDVEWLAKAIHESHDHPDRPGCLGMDRESAALLAAEYARLTGIPVSDTGKEDVR